MLRLTRMTSQDRAGLDEVNKLYDLSFPLHEQRTYRGREAVLSVDNYFLYQLMEGDQFIGLIGCWDIGEYHYIEHLAINPKRRGCGYGQKAIALFCQQFKQVILEIDPIADEISQKRLKFYENCGFVLNDYQHYHPSYRAEFSPHKLLILSYPHQVPFEDYEKFNTKLAEQIMHCDYL